MPIVTVFGGSGFVGRYVAKKLAKRGWRVRCAVRRPNEALFLRPYGDVGQVEPIQANVRDEDSTRRAIRGADAVINLVAILYPMGKQTFDATQLEGAERIARLCAEEGIDRVVHVSAIGADAGSEIPYVRTKGEAEAAMRRHVPSAAIVRPSLVFGPEDQFFNRFAGIARMSPVMPLIGAETRFQPVYVGDVAEAIVRALDTPGETYELGGPDVVTMREAYKTVLAETRRSRLILAMPWWLAKLQAWFMELPHHLFGLPPMLTRDQVEMLKSDNIVAEGAKGLGDLGITPTTMDSILPTYLYRYRPYGQYSRMRPGAVGQPARSSDISYTPATVEPPRG